MPWQCSVEYASGAWNRGALNRKGTNIEFLYKSGKVSDNYLMWFELSEGPFDMTFPA